MALLIKGGKVVDPAQNIEDVMDIYIEGDKIVKIEKQIEEKNVDVIFAKGKLVFPGFIDMHTHLREPGYEYKEDIETGSSSAVKGGFTSIACMANTLPPNDNEGVTSYIIERAKKVGKANVFPIGAVSKGLEGKELTEMGYMVEAGAVGFSDDGYPVRSSNLFRRALEYQRILGKVIIEHAEDLSLSSDGIANESWFTYKLGLKGIPDTSETSIIARDIEIAKLTKGHIHIAHVSAKRSIELIERAKLEGVNITAEVTPHHLLLNESYLETYDTNYKMKPPLRTEEDRKALLKALKKGVIDVIATDHAPHTEDEKDLEFKFAPFGVVGLETAIPLIYTFLVKKREITLKRFVEVLSLNPSKILGLERRGSLKVGNYADITIIDPELEEVIDPQNFVSKGKNSPFKGWKVKGIPVYTIVSGKVVYERA